MIQGERKEETGQAGACRDEVEVLGRGYEAAALEGQVERCRQCLRGREERQYRTLSRRLTLSQCDLR